MGGLKSGIPYYSEINDFLESISPVHRTKDPDFLCLRLRENDDTLSSFKAPFRKDFYFISLVSNAGRTEITYDNTNVDRLDSFLVFQSPGLVYSFYRDGTANGYLIYFKKECLSFFKPEIEREFPFFHILHTNFFKLDEARFREIAPHFEDVFESYENTGDVLHRVATMKLLALLYQMRELFGESMSLDEGAATPQQTLLQRFIQLVNLFYIEKRTIEDYATMLNVTPNHLSQSIRAASGKNASSHISDRLLSEARTLVRFTDLDIAEIAFQLDFSDPSNFGKFFKKHTGRTPLEYRRTAKLERSTTETKNRII